MSPAFCCAFRCHTLRQVLHILSPCCLPFTLHFPHFVNSVKHILLADLSLNSITHSFSSPMSIYVDTLDHRRILLGFACSTFFDVDLKIHVPSSGCIHMDCPSFSCNLFSNSSWRVERINGKNRTVCECAYHVFPSCEDRHTDNKDCCLSSHPPSPFLIVQTPMAAPLNYDLLTTSLLMLMLLISFRRGTECSCSVRINNTIELCTRM